MIIKYTKNTEKAFMSVTKVIIVLHSQHLDMIPFFFWDCKFFSGERVKIFWKNRENFLKKFFWSSLIFILLWGLKMGFESVLYFYTLSVRFFIFF